MITGNAVNVLRMIIESLPTNLDWLDPLLEREARAIIGEETKIDSRGSSGAGNGIAETGEGISSKLQTLTYAEKYSAWRKAQGELPALDSSPFDNWPFAIVARQTPLQKTGHPADCVRCQILNGTYIERNRAEDGSSLIMERKQRQERQAERERILAERIGASLERIALANKQVTITLVTDGSRYTCRVADLVAHIADLQDTLEQATGQAFVEVLGKGLDV